jgi:hypothetical protein
VPSSGETGWSGLSAFLIDVGNNAQTTAAQRGTIRIATSTPITVSSTDYTVLSDLTVPGAVAVTLPAGVDKTIYVIGDANGDAQTYNITITPASGLINDAATYVIKNNYGVVALQYSSAATMWKVIGRYFTKIDAANEVYGILGAANGGTGIANNAAATLTRSGNHALTLTTTGTTGLTLPTSGTVAVDSNKLSFFAATTSAELAGVISDETGSGSLVFATSPTFTTPVLGAATGTSLLLSGLTASRAMVTDGSKNLASSAVTGTELGYLSGVTTPTGSGALVLGTSPTLATPVLGVATATSINKVAITAPATSATLTIANGKTLTVSNTLTLTGTDSSSVAFGAGGTVTYTSNNLSVFASTTSAQLATLLSDETGSGLAVFGTSPTFLTSISLGAAAEARFYNAGGTFYTGFKSGNAAANKIWTLPLVDGASGTALKTDGSGTLSFGAVAGGGSVNYITESDFEDAATTGWVLYADAAATTPADGTGGSANVTVNARAASAFVGTYTASGVNPLRGTYSMEFAKDAANRQGQGTSIPFTIAYADISKPLRIDFECDAGTTYTASDMGVYVYDITNSTLITPSSVNIPGGASKFSVTFNATTSVSYRLIFHVQTTNATAYYLKFDSISISPNVLVQGAAIGDWQSYTPATLGLGTPGTTTCMYRRVGDSVTCRGFIDTGTVTGVSFGIGLPTGMAIDSTKIPGDLKNAVGWLTYGSGAGGAGIWTDGRSYALEYNSASTSYVYGSYSSGSAASGNVFGALVNGSGAFTSGDQFYFEFTVPVSNFTSNTTLATSRVEFSYNSSTSTSDDTTSYGYGADGVQFQSFTNSAGTAKTVQFQNAIQPTDSLMLEVTEDAGVTWYQPSLAGYNSKFQPYHTQNSVRYGITLGAVSGTKVLVYFGQYSFAGNATFGAAGVAWSGVAASNTYKWRVRKSSGIGAGEVAPVVPNATTGSSGYVDGVNGLKGFTDGSTATAGYLGEKIAATITADATAAGSDTETDVTSGSIALTAGQWLIFYGGALTITNGAGVSRALAFRLRVTNSGNTYVTGSASLARTEGVADGEAVTKWLSAVVPVNISASTTYKLRFTGQQTGTTTITFRGADAGNFTGTDNEAYFYAIRIR